MDSKWSETGDRYLLKLFRDYMFHQSDENGYPIVDIAHVLECLNKVSSNLQIFIPIHFVLLRVRLQLK